MRYHRDQYLIYINDLEDDISSKVLKFADDTKVFRKVTNVTDKQSLQDDLDKLVNPLDPTTAAAGLSVQSWNGRRRPHTGPTIKKNPGE